MKSLANQSNSANILLVFIGTSSMLLGADFYGNCAPLSKARYTPHCLIENNLLNRVDSGYSLKHELIGSNIASTVEPLVSMPVTKTIQVKFTKPTALEFTSIEDDQGFIE